MSKAKNIKRISRKLFKKADTSTRTHTTQDKYQCNETLDVSHWNEWLKEKRDNG